MRKILIILLVLLLILTLTCATCKGSCKGSTLTCTNQDFEDHYGDEPWRLEDLFWLWGEK